MTMNSLMNSQVWRYSFRWRLTLLT